MAGDDLNNKRPRTSEDEEASLSPKFKSLRSKMFTAMPQTPHYSPLDKLKFNSKVREGMMLGLDIAFIKLSQEIQGMLGFRKFLSEIDNLREQVTQLEEMGYNVKKLGERLDTMQKHAESSRASRDAAEKYEAEIGDHELNIANLTFKISELEEEIERSEKLIQNRKSKIRQLESDAMDAEAKLKVVAKSSW